MAISWNGPQLGSPIRTDVPELQKKLIALLKQDPTSVADIPAGAKRLVNTSGVQWQVQQYNGSSWAAIGKLMHDVDKLDGYHAAITPNANTVAVRNADKKLEGDITGNAATASSAATLSQTLPVNKGGTGATTSAAARTNLGVPPTSHASSGTAYGLGSNLNYGHVRGDGETTNIVTGEVVVKDVAIGGDASNLASLRGQIGNTQRITVKYPNFSDFNDVLDSGTYFCMNVDMSASNAPSTLGGMLKVIRYNSGNYVKQIFYIYNTNEILQRFFDRGNTTNPWSEWNPIITADSLATSSTPGIVKPDTVNGTTAVDNTGALSVISAPITIDYNVAGSVNSYKDAAILYYGDKNSYQSRVAVVRGLYENEANTAYLFSSNPLTNKVGASIGVTTHSDGTLEAVINCDLVLNNGNSVVIAANTLETGDLVASMNSSRRGYLLCNGAAVSRTTYADLFAVLGTAFGAGDGSTTFNLPDFRDKTFWGANGNLKEVIAAGLPNITGNLQGAGIDQNYDSHSIFSVVTGAFYKGNPGSDAETIAQGGLGSARAWYHKFDASRSSSTYGNSSTVQPPAIAVNIFIKY